jgi:hypothetical protein
MKLRSRLGVTVATATLGVLGLAACSPSAPVAATGTLSPEATALTALGFTDAQVAGTTADASTSGTPASPAPQASGSANGGHDKHPALRRLLIRRAIVAKHVEHGSVTVQTKNGEQTIDVQRGAITAISSTSMTVKSTDGYTLTWTFGDKTRILDNRATIQPSQLKVGETVGVAGPKTGSSDTARLVVVPKN